MVKMASESMHLEPESFMDQDRVAQDDTLQDVASQDVASQNVKRTASYVPADLFQVIETDFKDAEIGLNAKSLRGSFARSICKANHLATNEERAGCVEGVPCSKLQICMKQADHTLGYLDTRKKNTE